MYYNKLFTYLLLSDAEVGKDVTKNIVVGDYAYDFGEVIDFDAQAQVYLPLIHQPISNCHKRQSGNEACCDIACESSDVAVLEQLHAFVGEG